jgi:Mn2+/Fe2+ NRAMP family transporter
LLAPTLGTKAASIMFALALLASGQNSVITGSRGLGLTGCAGLGKGGV